MSDTPVLDTKPLPRSAAWRRWQMLSFDAPVAEPEPEPVVVADPGPDPEELRRQWRAEARAEGLVQGRKEGHAQGYEAGHKKGLEEGRAAGHAEGHSAGLAEARAQGADEAQRLRTLADASADSFAQIEARMGQSLLTLALDIAGQILRTTLAEQPESMLAAVREVLHLNPTSGGVMRLWVHPDDLELIRLHLADELRDGNWRVLADESIARGGCRAETPYGDIDATLQTRWRRVAASMGRSASWEEGV